MGLLRVGFFCPPITHQKRADDPSLFFERARRAESGDAKIFIGCRTSFGKNWILLKMPYGPGRLTLPSPLVGGENFLADP